MGDNAYYQIDTHVLAVIKLWVLEVGLVVQKYPRKYQNPATVLGNKGISWSLAQKM